MIDSHVDTSFLLWILSTTPPFGRWWHAVMSSAGSTALNLSFTSEMIWQVLLLQLWGVLLRKNLPLFLLGKLVTIRLPFIPHWDISSIWYYWDLNLFSSISILFCNPLRLSVRFWTAEIKFLMTPLTSLDELESKLIDIFSRVLLSCPTTSALFPFALWSFALVPFAL